MVVKTKIEDLFLIGFFAGIGVPILSIIGDTCYSLYEGSGFEFPSIDFFTYKAYISSVFITECLVIFTVIIALLFRRREINVLNWLIAYMVILMVILMMYYPSQGGFRVIIAWLYAFSNAAIFVAIAMKFGRKEEGPSSIRTELDGNNK